MILHIFLVGAVIILYIARKRIRSHTSAFVVLGFLSLLLIFGVATLGLLSATFILGPLISLYLMLLGHRKSAYVSIVAVLLYLSIMAILFLSGVFESAVSPILYVNSRISWILMIVVVAGTSIGFVASLELVPGALPGSEERFHLAFENANVGMCLTSLDGRFLRVNNALCEILGYAREELERMSVSEVTHEDDRELTLHSIQQQQGAGKGKVNFEKKYIHKQGSVVWTSISSSLIRDSQNHPQYFITHVQNITERKRGEANLKQALEWQEAVFEGSHDSVFISDQNSRFVAVNSAACELTGYSKEKLLTMRIPELHDQPDLAAYKKYNQKIFEGQEIVSEAKILRCDGSKVDVEFNNKRVSIAGILYMHTTARDITERRKAETALVESETKFRSVFENIHDVYFETALDGRILEISPSIGFLSKGQYTRDDVLGKSFLDFYHDPAVRSTFVKTLREHKQVSDFEIILKNRDGSLVECSISAKLQSGAFGNSEIISGTIRDISERKRAEEALRESENRFRQLGDATLEGIVISENGIVVDGNTRIAAMLGYELAEMIGKPVITFIAPGSQDLVLRSMGENVEEKFEHCFLRKDGSTIPVESHGRMITWNGKAMRVTVILDISERKKTEESLRVSEERFRSIYENSTIGLYRTAPDGTIILANPTLVKKLGYSTFDELAARNLEKEGFNPSYERKFFIDEIETRGEVNGLESAWTCQDGSLIYVRESARAVRDSNGKTLYYDGTVEDVTEQKQAETALRASESQFRELWGATVEGIAIHDNGIILEVNDAMCRMFRVGRDQAVGKSLFDFAPNEARGTLREYLASDEERCIEIPALRLDATKLVLEVFSKQILYRGNNVRMAAVRDISERKLAEDALRESEERYQRITKAITDYIYTVRVVDRRVAKTTHGPGCLSITGYNPDEFAKDPFLWLSMVVAGDRPIVEEQARRVLTGEAPLPVEHRIIHKNGAVRWVRNTFVLHHDQNGALTSYDGLIQDISERKCAEEALHESESKYRELVEGSPDAIAIYVEGKIVFVNSAGVELIGASSKEDLLGRPVIDLVHPEYREIVTARMKEARSTGKPLSLLEEKFVRFDGSPVDVEVKALPVTFGNRAGVQIIVRDITEKKKAQQALRESQLRYRATVEQSNEGITIADLDGRYTMVNPAFCRMTGYSDEELLTMKVSDLMTKQTSLKLFTRVATEHEAGYRELELRRKDGTTFIALITGSPLEIGNNRFVQGIVQDITERKRAEEALRESEERFHRMFEMHAAVMLLIEPVSGRINDANPAAEKFYGYSGEQLRGMLIQDINIMSPGEMAAERMRAVGNEKKSFNFSHRLANGDVRFVEVHSSPITLEGNLNLFSIIHDITERKEAEDQLRKLSLAVEQSPASIVITDTQGKIEYVNPKFTRVTGYTMEEVRGKKPSILKSGETSQEEYRKLWETITSGKEWRGEFHNRKKNGELFWEIASISPVKDKDNVVTNFLAVKEDITDRKRAEEALRHAQKLESIGTLAGGIAHDFNNLLNAIMGQSSLALGRLPKESPAGNNIAKSLKAAERAADLTRQLLAYSGKGKFLSDRFDLNRLVEENAQLLELSVPKNTQLRYQLDSSVLCIYGDIGQIQQVVMNLIINAGESFGQHPGYITVHTRRIDITQNDGEYWNYTNNPLPPGAYASLQVSDTGQGIKPELLARIFDPFFTTKFTGRGLGLAAVLGIIRGHHGGIRIQSEAGKGTDFEVVFPLADASKMIGAQETKEPPAINGEGRTILVIDDEPSILELLTDVFSEANFKVIEAINPMEGIELYRRHRHTIAMVILDYSMPGMDGKAAFEALVHIDKDVIVALCSGYTEEEIKSAFGNIRPHAFIQKPYKPSVLLAEVSSILAQGKSGR